MYKLLFVTSQGCDKVVITTNRGRKESEEEIRAWGYQIAEKNTWGFVSMWKVGNLIAVFEGP